MPKIIDIDEDLLHCLYYDLGISVNQIANIYNTTHPTIVNKMNKKGWKRRTISDALKGDKNPMFGKKGKLSPNFGKHFSEEIRKKFSDIKKGTQTNENNCNWKGNKVGYAALHIWIRKNKPKPEVCEECKQKKRLTISFNNNLKKYTRNINDYRWLCYKCHNIYDLNKRRKI